MPTVLLVRHGRTAANSSGVLAGWTPGIGLDDHGRAQVEALGDRIASAGVTVSRVVSSPLQRCQETAAIVVAKAADGIPVEADDRLGEARYGSWTGRKLSELAKEDLWRTVQDQPSAARFPDDEGYAAESLLEMGHRAVRTVRRHDAEVAAEHGPHALWVAVSHGDVIKAVLAEAAGSHFDHLQRFRADPASVSVVHYTQRRTFLVGANDMGSDLARLLPPGAPEVPEGDAPVGGGSAEGRTRR